MIPPKDLKVLVPDLVVGMFDLKKENHFFNFYVLTKLSILKILLKMIYIFRYLNGTHFLVEKYGTEPGVLDEFMNQYFNLGLSFAFPLGIFILNLVLYLIPLPAYVKAKFRE